MKNLIFILFIFHFFIFKLAHSVEFDNSIFNSNISQNLTRGVGSIGDLSISEGLTKININSIPLKTLDILDQIKINKNKTRGSVGQNIYSKYSKSVVLIYNDDVKGTGSGSIIMKDHGAILTNWHVIQGAKAVGVIFKNEGEIKKSDIYVAEVIGYDATKDLAILMLNGKVPDDVNEIKLSSALPEVGSDVHAIGHPGSLSWTYTKGYVSQIRKSYKWNYEKTLHEASIIQTQTPISPGNSGGPLLDSDGKLLGVNSFKAQGENLNFAVTSLEVINFLKNIKKIGKKEAKVKNENKKIDKVAKKVDTNDDGINDTFYYDEDGDGDIETVVKDENQNGKPEIIGVDTNNDGKPDLVGLDKNEDGKIDVWYVDKNFDGKSDLKGIDTDGDGKPDKFTKV